MKIKVCGMKYPGNIKEAIGLPLDYIGVIMYAMSPRYFLGSGRSSSDLENAIIREKRNLLGIIPPHIKKVGVVVNETPGSTISYINDFGFDCIQLHGTEDQTYCEYIRQNSPSTGIIKAINISEPSDMDRTKKYTKYACDYFLFDTKTQQHGGSGKKFDWNILNCYEGEIPFILSGGISIEDIDVIKSIKHPLFHGVDLNSRFETEPALKDINLLEQFIKRIKS